MTKHLSLHRRLRFIAAWGLLILPGFAYPLAWLKLWRDHVPFWSDTAAFSLPVLAVAAVLMLPLDG